VPADFDLAIVGSGFAGSLLAMIARRLGQRVLLIERHRHPRFAIGESSTPLANLLLETLADRYDLPRLRPLTKWGTWQATHPEIGCGLKRGFSFFHHAAGAPWPGGAEADPNRTHQLLVAASPNDAIADTHWFRPDFDQFFVREACALGVEFADETAITGLRWEPEFIEIEGRRHGVARRHRARFLIDASGPRGFIHRWLGLGDTAFADYPATEAVFSHFRGVNRWTAQHPHLAAGPFPADDAALHHVFEGAWMWVLRFNNGITSAGFAWNPAALREPLPDTAAAIWERLLARCPSLARQFEGSEAMRDFTHLPRLPWRAGACTGDRWAMLPMAVGFVDPLFSTGFSLSLLGVERIAAMLESGVTPGALDAYGRATFGDLDATAALIGAAWRTMGCPEAFQSVAMLYFSAVSFAESARRLGRAELAPGFLLREHAGFWPATLGCFHAAGRVPAAELARQVTETAAPFNVAGLCDPAKRNWYPVDAADLYAAAPRLGVSSDDITSMLRRAGFVLP
jgi:tetracycline 7-halogenase / FADH2 O2-dependent halogenase